MEVTRSQARATLGERAECTSTSMDLDTQEVLGYPGMKPGEVSSGVSLINVELNSSVFGTTRDDNTLLHTRKRSESR